MGKIVMPKNSALLNEIESVLKIYYEAEGWVENSDYKNKLKELIGDGQYSSSYTKKSQITSYFGFTIWEDITNPQSLRKITDSGKAMYEALLDNDNEKTMSVLMDSLENVTFGRDNYGCPDSDSDVEPPSLFVRAILDLDYLTYKEFAWLLWKLEDLGENYTDAIRELKQIRIDKNLSIGPEANKYTDCKPIMILVRWGFLKEDDSQDNLNGKHIIISPDVKKKYLNRLKNLKIYNIDKNKADDKLSNDEKEINNDYVEISRKVRLIKNFPLNFIIYGAPGTGKTYSVVDYSLAIINNKTIEDANKKYKDREEKLADYKRLIDEGRIVFTTFHQNYGYEEFIQGLRPDINQPTLSFKKEDGIFKKIADRALFDKNQENNYVIIIDEINRANISKVFGELITLIEEDKRWGEENQMCSTLQSGDIFRVPNNLYIIGTMNSADKSISLIDAALRRRFVFFEKLPDSSVIDPSLQLIFEKINENLVDELDGTDLLVGHSYFVNKKDDDLVDIMNNNVIPLFYEYFYDNRKKIASILNNIIDGSSANLELDNVKFGRLKVKKK